MVLTSRAGSAGGPKPGRAGFYLELGRADIQHQYRANLLQRVRMKAAPPLG